MYDPHLAYAHLQVRDLERAIDFYTRVFNLRVLERTGDRFAFLGDDARTMHSLVLQNVGARAPEADPRACGLHHLGFQVADQRALAAAYRALDDAGIETTLVDHGISWAIYFSDPDGNGLSFFWDRRAEPDTARHWHGCNQILACEELLRALPKVN